MPTLAPRTLLAYQQLEFSLGKLACEVDQWNRRPQSWGRGISLSLDLNQLTRVHEANLLR